METTSQVVIVSLSQIPGTGHFPCRLRIRDIEYDTEFYYATVDNIKALEDTSGVIGTLERHNPMAFRVIDGIIDKVSHEEDVDFPQVVPA